MGYIKKQRFRADWKQHSTRINPVTSFAQHLNQRYFFKLILIMPSLPVTMKLSLSTTILIKQRNPHGTKLRAMPFNDMLSSSIKSLGGGVYVTH